MLKAIVTKAKVNCRTKEVTYSLAISLGDDNDKVPPHGLSQGGGTR